MEPMQPMQPMQGMEPMKPMQPLEPIRSGGGQRWWPESLGDNPNSAGGQSDMRYAYFADKSRLAIDSGGTVTVHDTEGHQVSGVQQEQSGDGKKLVFTGGGKTVDLDKLPTVSK